MPVILDFLAHHPLLLLFLVVAVGYPLGRIQIKGASLGLSAVLFAGLLFGYVDPRLCLPDVLTNLGLAVFMYALGLVSARAFWSAFSLRGLRINGLALAALLLSTLTTYWMGKKLGLSSLSLAGLFAGASSSASGLAGLMDLAQHLGLSTHGGEAVVAYSIATPLAMLVPMATFFLLQKIFRVDLREEARQIPGFRESNVRPEVWTCLVSRPEAAGLTKRDLSLQSQANFAFGRIWRNGAFLIPHSKTLLEMGDLVVVVGFAEDLEKVTALLGQRSDVELDRKGFEFYDLYRFFVSDPAIVGRPLRELHLPSRHEGIITRVRRGEGVFVPDGSTVLELGDRVGLVALRDRRAYFARLFGDSYRGISEVDFLTLSLGLGLGLALGKLAIPLPGGLSFRLGLGGGPLLVALFLGYFQRIGNWHFNFPYSASLALRQFGLALFFAGAGTVAGVAIGKVPSGQAWILALMGAGLSLLISLVIVGLGYRMFRIPLNHLGGVLSGAQTNSAILSFAEERCANALPQEAYAAVYPFAIVFKILAAQLLLLL